MNESKVKKYCHGVDGACVTVIDRCVGGREASLIVDRRKGSGHEIRTGERGRKRGERKERMGEKRERESSRIKERMLFSLFKLYVWNWSDLVKGTK